MLEYFILKSDTLMTRVLKVLRTLALVCSVTAGIVAVCASAAPLLSESWMPDLLSNFLIPAMIVLLICTIICLSLQYYRWSAVLALGLVIVSFRPLLLFVPPPGIVLPGLQEISILNFNTEYQHNENFEGFIKLIDSLHPDIITLVEVNQKWLDALQPSLKGYDRVISLTGAGMAVFSKLPIKWHDTRFFGKTHHPRIFATMTSRSGTLDLIVIHPTTPKSPEGFVERNAELKLITDEAVSLRSAKIVCGDFNCGPWSQYFSSLLSSAEVRDSEQGFGLQPTWPARVGRISTGFSIPPLIPIDHILVGPALLVSYRHAGPSINSDHLPVFATFSIRPDQAIIQ